MKLKNVFLSGGSLVVPIPKEYAAALKLFRGSQVLVRMKDRRLLIEKAIITGAGLMSDSAPDQGGPGE